MDKVSVVTVTFNCEDVIESTILSVLSQTYKNLEFVIIDGKSTDGTLRIIEKYRSRINYILSEEDKGIFDAMNKGIKNSTGEWVIFMNAGDGFASAEALEKFINEIQIGVDIAYGNTIMVCNGYYYNQIPVKLEKMCNQMPMQHQSTLIRLSYHKEHLYDLTFRLAGDYNFLYNSYYNYKCKFQYIPIELSYFDNKGGASKECHIKALRETMKFYDRDDKIKRLLKNEMDIILFKIVSFVKRRILKTKLSQQHEINNLVQRGYEVVIGEYLFK